MHTCTHKHTNMGAHTHTTKHTQTHTHTYTQARIHTYTHTHKHAYELTHTQTNKLTLAPGLLFRNVLRLDERTRNLIVFRDGSATKNTLCSAENTPYHYIVVTGNARCCFAWLCLALLGVALLCVACPCLAVLGFAMFCSAWLCLARLCLALLGLCPARFANLTMKTNEQAILSSKQQDPASNKIQQPIGSSKP